ncbi:hypothetical protein NKH60_19330 [Mesorhizobium sp. M1006]|uniref:hypothetical protein n=1 Tax=Mesorhizobium sp. M1006 TaxID=2957048 RepID=UPI0033374D18
MTITTRSTSVTSTDESTKPYRGRRMSWKEFYALRPDLRPANDNEMESRSTAANQAISIRLSATHSRTHDPLRVYVIAHGSSSDVHTWHYKFASA